MSAVREVLWHRMSAIQRVLPPLPGRSLEAIDWYLKSKLRDLGAVPPEDRLRTAALHRVIRWVWSGSPRQLNRFPDLKRTPSRLNKFVARHELRDEVACQRCEARLRKGA
jgi:hypothetical protein